MVQTKEILNFICDEVTRQGHNINRYDDGWPRVVGMLQAWDYAIWRDTIGAKPTLSDIIIMATNIEPNNAHNIRNCEVRVGDRSCPPAISIFNLLENLWFHMGILSPDEFYVEFELIHPFRDGNGRTGKILHNWLSGTLSDPILIKDYFGGGNP